MTEFQAFARYPGETINAILSRYALVRQRAHEQGNFVQSVEACALQLLKACNCSPTQLMQFTAPFNGRMPSTETEFLAMQANMRRVGHNLEHSPNNIAQSLLPPRQAKPGAYLAGETVDAFMTGPSTSGNQDGPVTDWSFLGKPPTCAPSSYSPGQSDAQSQPQPDASSSSDATGSDTDTSSDSGNEKIDMTDVAGLTQKQAEAKIFWQYREHKRKWRRFTNKPVRKFRRHVNRFKKTQFHRSERAPGSGKGRFTKRKTFSKSWFTNKRMSNQEVQMHLNNKNLGHRANTSGKGFGRRGNPVGKDGTVMKCHTCGSEQHLKAECPKNKGNNEDAPAPTFQTDVGPNPYLKPYYLASRDGESSSGAPVELAPRAGPLDDLLGPAQQEEQGYFTFPDDTTRTDASMFMVNMRVVVVEGFQQTPATDHSAEPRDASMTPGRKCSACGDRVYLPNSDYPTCECGRFQCNDCRSHDDPWCRLCRPLSATMYTFGHPLQQPPSWPVARPQLASHAERIGRQELRQAFAAHKQQEAALDRVHVLPACTWCGQPTGGFCDYCSHAPMKAVCSDCGGTDASTMVRCYDCTRKRALFLGYDSIYHKNDSSESEDDDAEIDLADQAMLSSPSQHMQTFMIGSREYDPLANAWPHADTCSTKNTCPGNAAAKCMGRLPTDITATHVRRQMGGAAGIPSG